MRISVLASWIAVVFGLIALVLLLSLHFLSPQFDPSFRMISEYALGSYGNVLSWMFFTWAVSTWALFFSIRSEVKTVGGKIGLFFLLVAGVGMLMGGLFDIKHSLHGAAFALGVPALPIAAVLITKSLVRSKPWSDHKKFLWGLAHATWISLILMAVTLSLFIYSYTQGGGVMGATPQVNITLPEGTIAVVGWFNRLLVLIYIVWVVKVAWKAIKLQKKK